MPKSTAVIVEAQTGVEGEEPEFTSGDEDPPPSAKTLNPQQQTEAREPQRGEE